MNNFLYTNQPPLHAGGYHHSNEYAYDCTAVGHKYSDRPTGGQGLGKSEPSLNSNWLQNRGNGQSYCYPQQTHQLQLPMGIQTDRPRPSHVPLWRNYTETDSWSRPTPIVGGDLPAKRYEPYDASRQKQNWSWNQNRKEDQGYRNSYPQQQTQANKLNRPLKEMYKSTSHSAPRANWTASNNAKSESTYRPASQQLGFRSKFASHGQRYNEGKFKKAKVASPFGIQKCDVCLVDLNSSLQAKMHYVGKKHEKKFKLNALMQGKKTGESSAEQEEGAVSSEKKPGSGNLTETNKLKPDGQPEQENNSSGGGVKKLEASLEPSNQFTCKLCNVITTSADQLDAHYNGAKHKKASKLAGDTSFEEKDKIPVAVSAGSLLLLPLQMANASTGEDKSNGRTPAGTFFCKTCNIMLNSETQFAAHCESKKHKKK